MRPGRMRVGEVWWDYARVMPWCGQGQPYRQAGCWCPGRPRPSPSTHPRHNIPRPHPNRPAAPPGVAPRRPAGRGRPPSLPPRDAGPPVGTPGRGGANMRSGSKGCGSNGGAAHARASAAGGGQQRAASAARCSKQAAVLTCARWLDSSSPSLAWMLLMADSAAMYCCAPRHSSACSSGAQMGADRGWEKALERRGVERPAPGAWSPHPPRRRRLRRTCASRASASCPSSTALSPSSFSASSPSEDASCEWGSRRLDGWLGRQKGERARGREGLQVRR